MAFTYDVTTDVGKVRLLIPDRDEQDVFFQDGEIEAFLLLSGESVMRAAAMGLETIASNEAYVQKKIRLMDLSTDGPAVASELRQRASALRTQANELEASDDGGAFDIAEMDVDVFTARQILSNQALRGAL